MEGSIGICNGNLWWWFMAESTFLLSVYKYLFLSPLNWKTGIIAKNVLVGELKTLSTITVFCWACLQKIIWHLHVTQQGTYGGQPGFAKVTKNFLHNLNNQQRNKKTQNNMKQITFYQQVFIPRAFSNARCDQVIVMKSFPTF